MIYEKEMPVKRFLTGCSPDRQSPYVSKMSIKITRCGLLSLANHCADRPKMPDEIRIRLVRAFYIINTDTKF